MPAGAGPTRFDTARAAMPGPSVVWRWHVAPVAMPCSECGRMIPAGGRFAVAWAPYTAPGGHGWQSDGDEAVCGACQPHVPLQAPDLADLANDLGDDDLWP